MNFRIWISFMALALAGLALVPTLSVEWLPTIQEPALSISYQLPHASPEQVEAQATAPLENVLSQLVGLKKIASVSNQGQGRIAMHFGKHENMDAKRFEIISLIRQVYPQLPRTLSYPILSTGEKRSADASPLLVYSIYAPFSPEDIRQTLQDGLLPHLSLQPGVAEAQVHGATDLQVRLQANEAGLQAYRLSPQDLVNAIRESTQAQQVGMATVGAHIFHIYLPAHQDWRKLSIQTPLGYAVPLETLASLAIEPTPPASYYRVNGQDAVRMAIYAHPNENRLALAQTLRTAIEQYPLPTGYQVNLDADDSEFMAKELRKIYLRSGLSVAILLLFVWAMQRNWRYLAVLLSGLGVNLMLAVLAVKWLGLSINLYTLAGATVSMGLVIDNAIVMIDHLHKRGDKRVFLALLAATLTTIAALGMVLLLPEKDRQQLTGFAQIVAVNLVASLAVALFYTPAAYRLLFGHRTGNVEFAEKGRLFNMYERAILWLLPRRRWVSLAFILAFGLPVFWLPAQIKGWDWYNASIGSSLYQEEIRPWTDPILGGSLRLFVRNVYEKWSYREPERTRLFVTAEMGPGATLEQMNEVIKKVEGFLGQTAGLEQYVSEIHSGRYGQVRISFEPRYENGILPYQLQALLTAQAIDWGGVEWSIYGVGRGFNNSMGNETPSFKVEMRGYNYHELARQSERLAEKLLAHKRIQEVNTNERLSYNEKADNEYVLRLNSDAMRQWGLRPGELGRALVAYTPATQPSANVRLNGKVYGLAIEYENAQLFSAYHLMNRPLPIDATKKVLLGNLGTLSLEKTSSAIHKENREYIRMVGFNYFGSPTFGEKYLTEVLKEMNAIMTAGYRAKQSKYTWDMEQTKRQYSLLLWLALAIFGICAVLFEHLKRPLLIIACIPLSFIGHFLTFSLFELGFDQGGYAAFVLLSGLVVNAAIFIVNDFQNLPGAYNERVLEAVRGKAVPILLTVLSSAMGLVPFLLEGSNEVFWSALAAGTMGGLIFSLMAVFLWLPLALMKQT